MTGCWPWAAADHPDAAGHSDLHLIGSTREPPTARLLANEHPGSADAAAKIQVKDLDVRWTKAGAFGLPAVIDENC